MTSVRAQVIDGGFQAAITRRLVVTREQSVIVASQLVDGPILAGRVVDPRSLIR
jgi:hypothetical protein